jgi:ribosomal protein S18 acetylase RimI-like enzyme
LGQAFAARWDGQSEGRWEVLTAWDETRLVGSAVLRWEGPFNAEVAAALPQQVELGFLQIEPDYRGQGIGTALLRLAEQRCRERGVTRLGLGVALDNSRAVRLYQRLGYEDSRLRFTDTYTGTDPDGASRLMVEPGLYMTHNLTAGAQP